MNDLITIILNVYNGEKYIKKCLDSIINQTYRNLEILVVNDGSTDNTLSICKSYNDERIKIINQNNMGLSLARNVGIENSNGKYLYFIDYDDFIEQDTIEYLYKLCIKYNSKIATCNPLDIYEYKYIVKNKKEKIDILSGIDFVKMILLSKKRSGTIWNKLLNRELFNNIRFEDRGVNDVVVVYKLVLQVDNIIYSNQIKYYYYRNLDSITMKKRNPERTIDFYNASIERFEYLDKKYPNMVENYLGLERIIINSYLHKDKSVRNYLNEKNAIKLFNDCFSFKLLKCKIGFKEKIKIILFKMNPNIFLFIMDKYLALKK